MPALIIAVIVVAFVLFIVLVNAIKIVRQSQTVVIERLGRYHATLDTGVHFVVPFLDRALPAISLKEKVADFPPQPIITKDNVTMSIDTVVYYQITDPKLFSYGVERPINAIENLTATTLRNIVGELELDQTLTSRDMVNSKMCIILDEATDPWGIKINRVELKNIDPPKAIREAMEKQMRAERERREAILLAEGDKQSNILRAEGERQSQILRAEASKQAHILSAEAQKQALITEAEGQMLAIEKIMSANPSSAYLTLQGYEALKVMANGKATKLIVPSNLQDLTSIFSAVKESVTLNEVDLKENIKSQLPQNPIKK